MTALRTLAAAFVVLAATASPAHAGWFDTVTRPLDRLLNPPPPPSEPEPTEPAPTELAAEPLSWKPPPLSAPTVIDVPNSPDRAARTYELDRTRDYIFRVGHLTHLYGLSITGGRNIVIKGGRISIPWSGDPPGSVAARRGLILYRNAGIVHVEGLLIDGPDLSEGIQIGSPDADIRLQNVRIVGVHARDEVNFSDNHPDCLQPWGGARAIRIDRMTCTTDAHGIYFDSNDARRLGGPIALADIRRYNIRRAPATDDYGTGRRPWLFQRVTQNGDQPMTLTDLYVEPYQSSLYNNVGVEDWTDGNYRFFPAIISSDGKQASWPQAPNLRGVVKLGPPPGGDFVPQGVAGTGYSSPGYRE